MQSQTSSVSPLFPFHLFVIKYTAGERYITSGDVKEHKTIVDYFLASAFT